MNPENLSQQSLLDELEQKQQHIEYLEAKLAEKNNLTSTQNVLMAIQLSDTCQQLIQAIYQRIQADSVTLFLVDHSRKEIALSLICGLQSKASLTYAELTHGLSGQVLDTQVPILSQSANDEINNTIAYARRLHDEAESLLVVPLFAYDDKHKHCIGTITVVNHKHRPILTTIDLEIAQALIHTTQIRMGTVRILRDMFQAQFDYRIQFDIYHNISQGVCLISKQTLDIVQVNSCFEEIFGCRSQDVINKPSDFFPTDELIRLQHQFPETSVQYDYWQNELQNKHSNGSDVWCTVNISTTEHPQYGWVWVCVYTDITNQKREEERYQYQEHLLGFVLDAVVSADPDFNIRTWNKAAEAMYGWTEEEVLGHNATDLFRTEYFDGTTSQDFQQKYSEEGVWRGEMIHHHKDGTLIPIRGTSGAIRNDKGERIGVVTILRDITDELEAERTLKASEERYRMISELMSDYAFQFNFEDDGSWSHVWATDETLRRITGYDAKEVPGTYGLYAPMEVEHVQQDIEKIRDGKDTEGEYRIITKDGQNKWLFIRRRVIWDKNHDHVIGFYGAGKDITARKQAEQDLVEYNKEKERINILQNFIQDASHDLKTPLSTINTSIYILNKLATTDKQVKQLGKLQFNVNHLSKLIEDMFTMSGLDLIHRLSLTKVDFNLSLHDIIRIYRPIIENKNIALVSDLSKTPLFALVDVESLTQAITNIIENAISFTSENGQITIRSYQEDECVVIAIEDDGIGISAEELPNIFTRFYRGDKSRGSNTVASTGLGLSLARKIIELHDGYIDVKSKLDEGSSFYIYLPQ